MRRRIFRGIYLISLATLIFSTIFSTAIYYQSYITQIKADLKSQSYSTSVGAAAASDPASYLEDCFAMDPSVRLTLLSRDGDVLYDSNADESIMENHRDRPEFQEALQNGYGEGQRFSSTLGRDTYYSAVRLGEDGAILRLSRNTQNILGAFLHVLPFELLFCAVLFVILLLFSKLWTKRILSPLLSSAEHLEDIRPGESYEELSPFFDKINEQNATIRSQMELLKEEKDTITTVLENMQEGLILLDHDKRILSLNQSARHFLHIEQTADVQRKNIVSLTRNADLLLAVDHAVKGVPSEGIIPCRTLSNAEGFCRYFVHPVAQENCLTGLLILFVDITEQLKAQKIREEFSANVSHELKTPLTSISGFAEMLSQGMVKNQKEVAEFSGMIYKEAQRLLHLIDDIIRLSCIEEGKNQAEEAADLYVLAKQAVEHLTPLAKQENIDISLSGGPSPIVGNITQLYELVFNLCENAVKYNVPHGKVQIETLPLENSSVRLTVSDTGIGIPKEHQERIFERFYRVDKSRSKQTGGTGLGLSIVKHIAEQHHGSISLSSAPGRGTTITVLFSGRRQQ